VQEPEPIQAKEAPKQKEDAIQEEPTGADKASPISSNPEGLEVTILKNYTQTNAKAAMENFVVLFQQQVRELRNLLSKRQLQNTTSIMHLKPGQRPRS